MIIENKWNSSRKTKELKSKTNNESNTIIEKSNDDKLNDNKKTLKFHLNVPKHLLFIVLTIDEQPHLFSPEQTIALSFSLQKIIEKYNFSKKDDSNDKN